MTADKPILGNGGRSSRPTLEELGTSLASERDANSGKGGCRGAGVQINDRASSKS